MADPDDALLAHLEAEAAETPARFRRQGKILVIGSIVVGAIAAARAIWVLVPVCLVFGALMFLLFRAAAAKNGPARSGPVLRALRDDPKSIRSIAHTETSDSRHIFTTHWIVVETADGLLRVKADDWAVVIDALARRCPGATVKR